MEKGEDRKKEAGSEAGTCLDTEGRVQEAGDTAQREVQEETGETGPHRGGSGSGGQCC